MKYGRKHLDVLAHGRNAVVAAEQGKVLFEAGGHRLLAEGGRRALKSAVDKVARANLAGVPRGLVENLAPRAAVTGGQSAANGLVATGGSALRTTGAAAGRAAGRALLGTAGRAAGVGMLWDGGIAGVEAAVRVHRGEMTAADGAQHVATEAAKGGLSAIGGIACTAATAALLGPLGRFVAVGVFLGGQAATRTHCNRLLRGARR